MNKLKDAIYGFAVADALGVPLEFKKRGTFKCTEMIGHGTWNQEVGTWSDDTSMTLATCDSIRESKKIDIDDIRSRFVRWMSKGEYTANNEMFDIGETTSNALHSGYGLDHVNSNGNGSLMRILPLAFIAHSINDVHNVSAITHAHDVSKYGCEIYVDIAVELLHGQSIRKAIDKVTACGVPNKYERLPFIAGLEERDIKSTGYVVDTLEASLWCLTQTNNYKDAVIKAVNLGDDTDTVAAVTGGLAGIMYGYDSIPKEWIEKLRNKELIDSCLF